MKRYAVECPGCCWAKKANDLYWVCIFIECPAHPQYIGHSDQPQNGNGLIIETCFT